MPTTPPTGFGTDLHRRYLRRLETSLWVLQPIAGRLARKSVKAIDVELLEREAHRLAGSGATYGYTAISEAASALEAGLQTGERGAQALSTLLAPLVAAMAAAIREDAPEAITPPQPQAETGRVEYRPLILIGGDDPNACHDLAAILKPFARVECFSSSEAVLYSARRQRFDLIVIDYAPDSDTGREVLAGLTQYSDAYTAPVVMLTERQNMSPAPYIAAGVRDCIAKPFAPEILVARVKTLLSRQKPVVLIADDDPLIRGLVRSKLRQRGVDVSVAVSGSQALDMASRLRPHAIILDRIMPRLDGMQVLASIRNNIVLSNTPVLILSARRADTEVADGLALGADDYICKPFLPDNVVERCLHLLRTSRQQAA